MMSEVLSLKRNMNGWKVDLGNFIACFCEGLHEGVSKLPTTQATSLSLVLMLG